MAERQAYWQAFRAGSQVDRIKAYETIESFFSNAKTALEIRTQLMEEGINVKAIAKSESGYVHLGTIVNNLEDGELFRREQDKGSFGVFDDLVEYHLVERNMPVVLCWHIYSFKKEK